MHGVRSQLHAILSRGIPRASIPVRAQKAELRALINSVEKSEQLTQLLRSRNPAIRKAAIQGIAGGGNMNIWPWPQPRPPFP
jgi:hypothetical protein